MEPPAILKVAVPTPLRKPFDYLLSENFDPDKVKPGQRVRVPFGKRTVVGFVLALTENSEVSADKLKPVLEFLDEEPALDEHLLSLYLWSGQYYHYPVGQAMQTSLPVAVRSGKALEQWSERLWQLTETGRNTDPQELKRAPRQQTLLEQLQQEDGLSSSELSRMLEAPVSTQLKALQDKGLVSARRHNLLTRHNASDTGSQISLALNEGQTRALETITDDLDSFHCHLLEGVTGSGKTEVYLQAIDQILARGRQVLILVPEIGLTPQTIKRFRARFAAPLVTLHSGLSDSERFNAWLQARSGLARIIIGTRSAVFTPLAEPGLIIVDEEHDASYKQQEGFRYSARDIAIYRARQLHIPVILGSATPSLESLQNASLGRFSHLHLANRAGAANLPTYRFIDLRGETMQEGFSSSLLDNIAQHLARQQQVLVFINRRGFAPMLQCHDCGWIASCPRCEMGYTLHQQPPQLICHHCDKQAPVQRACPQCASGRLLAIGQGTERSEQFLKQQFPDVDIFRVDRDSTRGKDALSGILARVDSGKPCILIGTQMLAKGHHFPGVTLVAILEADSGLFSANFRGQEFLGQLLTQVAGRAGRGDAPGTVLIQTHHRDHPGLKCLVEEGYGVFARNLLDERRQQALPPFSFQVLLRAEAGQRNLPLTFLEAAADNIHNLAAKGVNLLGPLPAPLEKRAGKFRFQLLLQSASRASLHDCLKTLLPLLEQHELGRRVQWSVDIDPLDFT